MGILGCGDIRVWKYWNVRRFGVGDIRMWEYWDVEILGWCRNIEMWRYWGEEITECENIGM